MKNLIYLLVISFILSGCASSKKYFQKGKYDQAINKAVKKIRKNPSKTNDILILDKSYNLANERNLERIRFLKLEANPDTWDEILSLYSALKTRQRKVRTVLPLELPDRTINYKYVDYNKEIIESKNRAAEYFYANAKKLMGNNDKESFRQAYYELLKAKDYTGGGYLDIDKLINEARLKGISRAIVIVKNQTHFKLSKEFEENLLSFNTSNLNSEWVEYHTKHLDDNVSYDYFIYVNLKIIDVSPERVKETEHTETKKIEDGWEYVLDGKGNVKKDSLGNDIKVPKIKTIKCILIKNLQQKSVHVEGLVEILSNQPRKTLKKENIAADGFFEHISAKANGDLNALSPESKKLIKKSPVPFPHDLDMIYQAGETLKIAIKDVLRRNRRFVK